MRTEADGYFADRPAKALQVDIAVSDPIVRWLSSRGVEVLVGDPMDPANMLDSNGERHTAGIYMDPLLGELVLRSENRTTYRVAIGDWVVSYTAEPNLFFVVKDQVFKKLFSTNPPFSIQNVERRDK